LWKDTEQRFASVRDELAKKKALLAQYDERLARLNKRQNELADALSESDVQAKSMSHKIQRFNAETEATRRSIDRMLTEYEWIGAESQFFGKAHTDYDFAATDPSRVEKELAVLMQEQQKLEGTINKKVASMISEADRKYEDLQAHKAKVEQNKAQIHASIEELDRKKLEALGKRMGCCFGFCVLKNSNCFNNLRRIHT
jgi:structural maintenance of chromosome 2